MVIAEDLAAITSIAARKCGLLFLHVLEYNLFLSYGTVTGQSNTPALLPRVCSRRQKKKKVGFYGSSTAIRSPQQNKTNTTPHPLKPTTPHHTSKNTQQPKKNK
jgi:hypothetical protein